MGRGVVLDDKLSDYFDDLIQKRTAFQLALLLANVCKHNKHIMRPSSSLVTLLCGLQRQPDKDYVLSVVPTGTDDASYIDADAIVDHAASVCTPGLRPHYLVIQPIEQ
jgi:hypothetical protein